MKKDIELDGNSVSYEIRESRRAKNLRLSVTPARGLVVTIPWFVSEKKAERFIKEKSDWVLKNIKEAKNSKRLGANDYDELKDEARKFVHKKVDQFNRLYNFEYNKIFIRNQKTRWGSCSSKKNLNFNFMIIKLPESLADYVVVHELCHLRELNHSKDFWNLVAFTIPDYKDRKKEFKNYRLG